jgi:hypothetical protein
MKKENNGSMRLSMHRHTEAAISKIYLPPLLFLPEVCSKQNLKGKVKFGQNEVSKTSKAPVSNILFIKSHSKKTTIFLDCCFFCGVKTFPASLRLASLIPAKGGQKERLK